MNFDIPLHPTGQIILIFIVLYGVHALKATQYGYKHYIKINKFSKYLCGFFFYDDDKFTLFSVIGQLGNIIIIIIYIIISIVVDKIIAYLITMTFYGIYIIIVIVIFGFIEEKR
ncbi:hypothetical protein [Oceanirhabdus sp. W0125-5]|uniref:hypothetical protein n=1 Tax=Oceanirhabdus sp. W0125-5 TaxID=2999116 RepID=UPI0022F307BB|nr:hypothetical protein [Oceanirhabdus sp. W0125-5]WBW97430.1 hypothetical protein OW730_00820 [Oceanirhabdus sp. W0125-5]